MKPVTLLAATGIAVLMSASTAPAGIYIGSGGFDDDFATEYCRYYKTRAYYAGRQERAGKRLPRGKTRRVLWAQYIACLEKYGTPGTYIPR
jgi:hypothetical protein